MVLVTVGNTTSTKNIREKPNVILNLLCVPSEANRFKLRICFKNKKYIVELQAVDIFEADIIQFSSIIQRVPIFCR
jgi:hypothetical protein